MTKFERWLLIAVALVAGMSYRAFPRYELQFREGVVLRWDRWTGHLDATNSLKSTPWATVTLAPASVAQQSAPLHGVARFEDIASIEPPKQAAAPAAPLSIVGFEPDPAPGSFAADLAALKKKQQNR